MSKRIYVGKDDPTTKTEKKTGDKFVDPGLKEKREIKPKVSPKRRPPNQNR